MREIKTIIGVILMYFSTSSYAIELKTGDLILQPLNCWVCSLIESQEKSIYSHMGIIVENNSQHFVAEAYQEVQLTPLNEFLEKTEKGQTNLVLRFKDYNLDDSLVKNRIYTFMKYEYDNEFLWNNRDANGSEKIYCSELAYKVFDGLISGLPLKRMQFDINTNYWERYFKGNVPYNEIGVSPADFERSSLLYRVGEL